jgi:hypothetical protein
MPSSSKKRKDGKSYSMGAAKAIELELPSFDANGDHNVCLVRRPGPQGLVKMGVLDSLDALTSIVSSRIMDIESGKMKAGPGGLPDKETMKALSQNKENLAEALDLIDKIVVGVVVEPKVLAVPAEAKDRDDEALYVDEVELEDRVFIMNFAVGGSADWESFRQRSAENVAGVETSEGVRDDSEQPARG